MKKIFGSGAIISPQILFLRKAEGLGKFIFMKDSQIA